MNLYGETSDEYPNLVVMLDAKTRVIAADIQWIMQRRTGDRWLSQLFFRTKEGLLFYTPKPYPAELLALPDRFPEGEQRRGEACYRRQGLAPGLRLPPELAVTHSTGGHHRSAVRPSTVSVIELSSAA